MQREPPPHILPTPMPGRWRRVPPPAGRAYRRSRRRHAACSPAARMSMRRSRRVLAPSMLDGILDQRLERGSSRCGGRCRLGCHVEARLQTIAEPRLLDGEVGREAGHLHLDRNHRVIDAVEANAADRPSGYAACPAPRPDVPEISSATPFRALNRKCGSNCRRSCSSSARSASAWARIVRRRCACFGHLRAQPEIGEAPSHEGKEVMHEWDEKLFDAATMRAARSRAVPHGPGRSCLR